MERPHPPESPRSRTCVIAPLSPLKHRCPRSARMTPPVEVVGRPDLQGAWSRRHPPATAVVWSGEGTRGKMWVRGGGGYGYEHLELPELAAHPRRR